MPEHWLCIEEYLLTAVHRRDGAVVEEPQDLVDEDWKEGFE